MKQCGDEEGHKVYKAKSVEIQVRWGWGVQKRIAQNGLKHILVLKI